MKSYYYKKSKKNYRKIIRLTALCTSIASFILFVYIFFPLALWQVYSAPAFASQDVATPIPHTTVVNSSTITSLISTGVQTLSGIDFSNAQNWFPDAGLKKTLQNNKNPFYTLSIPKLGIQNATVSTIDYDLNSHLVNYPDTGIPPDNGNAVIFGHSTLPQWFNPKDYKAIFATVHTLTAGDEIFTLVNGVTYKYKIFAITVVDPNDTSVFSQTYDTSYITLITCTPPGTVWKRLVIRARLVPPTASLFSI